MNENFSFRRKPQLRRLSVEEIELWRDVTRGVAPRPGSRLPEPPQTEAEAAVPSGAAVGEPSGGGGTSTPSPAANRQLPPRLVPLERRLLQKLARGHAAPDAAIDLHGMRSQEAFLALRRFLTGALAEGARLVLVVTGKGERTGSGEARGILRKNVPHWLRSPDYHAIVAGFEEAARPHGGSGALYVKLRRRDRAHRKKLSP